MILLRIGAHMSVSGGKFMAFERGKELGCEAIQVYIRNVRGWTSGPLKQKEIDAFIKKVCCYLQGCRFIYFSCK